MAWKNFKPPSGMPASGTPANGLGWGGPAGGYVHKPNRRAITSENNPREAAKASRMDGSGAARRALAEQRSEMLKEKIFEIATSPDTPVQVAVNAASAWLDRHEGKPIARVINTTVDDVSSLSDDALRDELARLGGAGIDPASGDTAPGMSPQPGSVRH